VDRDLPSRIRTFEQITAEIAGPQQEMSTLLSVFAAMAILIAVTGVYGVASFTAQFSTREIGIRMALGAQRKDILWSFAKQSGTLALLGLLAGLGGSLLVAKALKSLLFEVQGSDPATMAMVSVFVVALVLVAMLVPAKRACSTNPAVVLRES
jgi:ABC-type antimicrobial peptide transport system permease subunit